MSPKMVPGEAGAVWQGRKESVGRISPIEDRSSLKKAPLCTKPSENHPSA